jgi:hypothetical protein
MAFCHPEFGCDCEEKVTKLEAVIAEQQQTILEYRSEAIHSRCPACSPERCSC